jgi:hypothetical protein
MVGVGQTGQDPSKGTLFTLPLNSGMKTVHGIIH